MSDTGMSIPKEIFLKIAQYSVPNLLCPTHPKEIIYQDQKLKPYVLVCKTWRDILCQCVDFEEMMKLFVLNNGWSYGKCFRNLEFRWSRLNNLYGGENQWLVDQKHKIATVGVLVCNDEAKRLKKVGVHYSICSNEYRKIMKGKLKQYDCDGLVMLKVYIANQGFLNTHSFIRVISHFLQFVDSNSFKAQSYDCLKKIVTMFDLTDVFSRLFEGFIRRDENYYSSLLTEEIKIDYRRFLYMTHLSFYQRVKSYQYNISFCSQGEMRSIPHFFNLYKSSFTLKDQNNRSFLYYLLLYSKDNFLRIQAMLLVSFIKGIEKKLSDYSEDEIIVYRKLFEKNFLYRLLSSDDEQYLKSYFGVPF